MLSYKSVASVKGLFCSFNLQRTDGNEWGDVPVQHQNQRVGKRNSSLAGSRTGSC